MDEFKSLMGMYEMEFTLEEIYKRCVLRNCPFQDAYLNCSDFVDKDSRHLLIGFCCLLGFGWLEPDYPNGYFKMSQGLVERLRTRELWKDLPYAKGYVDRMAKRMEELPK